MCTQAEKCESCKLYPCGKTTCSHKRIINAKGQWETVSYVEYTKIRTQEQKRIKNGAIPMNFNSGAFMFAGVSKR